ncbi:MAG: hypothetical protein FD123_297 [Bacteroidetes bacterium]|nr:MAG: hypothetical protein FD123_297 [Bacteroidota bacterium]
MKAIRIVDLCLQGLILVIAMGCAAVIGKNDDKLIYVALLQIPMGILQLISAIVTSAASWKIAKEFMLVYWIWVGVYFFGLGLFAILDMEDVNVAWFFSAWCIAIYYFVAGILIGRREARKAEQQQYWQMPYPPQ